MDLQENTEVPAGLLDRVRKVAAEEYGKDVEFIGPDTLLSDLGDSLDRVQFAMSLEDEFGVGVTDDEALVLTTIHSVALLVADKEGGK